MQRIKNKTLFKFFGIIPYAICSSCSKSIRINNMEDFKNTKVNLQEVQLKFDTQTKQISRNEILAEVFNIDNNVSLI